MAPRPLSPSGTDRNPVKFWVLVMFFGAGVGLAVLGLSLPDGPGARPALGQALLVGNGICSLIALALLLTARRWPPLKRFDLPLLILAQAATLGGVLGETFLFGTQYSIMTQLWVTVFAAGSLPRRLVWAQQGLGLASITLMVWMRAEYGATPPRLWGVDALVTALPVVLTGVAVAYFRGEAEREARAGQPPCTVRVLRHSAVRCTEADRTGHAGHRSLQGRERPLRARRGRPRDSCTG